MKIIDTTAFSLTLAATLAVCTIVGSVAVEEKKRNLFSNKSVLKKHGKRGAPGSLEFGYGLPARIQNNQPPIYGPPEPAPVYENHQFAAPSAPVYNQPAVLENPGHQIHTDFHPAAPVQIPQPIAHPPPYPVGFPAAVQIPHPVAAPVSQPAVYHPVGVPVVQTVTKHVGVPVPVPVHVAVPVPRPYPVQVEKIVHVEKPVHYPVHIDRPVAVPVHVPVPVPVAVPRPYPVERYVHVDRPYPVHIAVPVHVPKPYPVPVAIHKTQWKPAATKYGW